MSAYNALERREIFSHFSAGIVGACSVPLLHTKVQAKPHLSLVAFGDSQRTFCRAKTELWGARNREALVLKYRLQVSTLIPWSDLKRRKQFPFRCGWRIEGAWSISPKEKHSGNAHAIEGSRNQNRAHTRGIAGAGTSFCSNGAGQITLPSTIC